jgi:hypothetical protein
MNFYSYKGVETLGNESAGSEGKHITKDLKTLKGVINRMKSLNYEHFKVYSFTNFYKNSTFKLLYEQ